jgi:hypothetical protein
MLVIPGRQHGSLRHGLDLGEPRRDLRLRLPHLGPLAVERLPGGPALARRSLGVLGHEPGEQAAPDVLAHDPIALAGRPVVVRVIADALPAHLS